MDFSHRFFRVFLFNYHYSRSWCQHHWDLSSYHSLWYFTIPGKMEINESRNMSMDQECISLYNGKQYISMTLINILITLMAVSCVLNLVLNVGVVYALWSTRQLKTTSLKLICSLSVSDALIGTTFDYHFELLAVYTFFIRNGFLQHETQGQEIKKNKKLLLLLGLTAQPLMIYMLKSTGGERGKTNCNLDTAVEFFVIVFAHASGYIVVLIGFDRYVILHSPWLCSIFTHLRLSLSSLPSLSLILSSLSRTYGMVSCVLYYKSQVFANILYFECLCVSLFESLWRSLFLCFFVLLCLRVCLGLWECDLFCDCVCVCVLGSLDVGVNLCFCLCA